MPPADVSFVVHDLLADEAAGYLPTEQFGTGADEVHQVGLQVELTDGAVVVGRLPGWAAYPLQRKLARLFTLKPGQIGRYRANFRFTGCAGSLSGSTSSGPSTSPTHRPEATCSTTCNTPVTSTAAYISTAGPTAATQQAAGT
jgi:hypothetical protein